MDELSISVVQLGVYPSKRQAAVREAERATRRAAGKGARLICFPEHWLLSEVFEVDNEVVRHFSKLGRKLGVYINLGAFYERRASGTYLTSVMISPSGEDYFRQDKVHLYRRERRAAVPGTGFGTCRVDGFRVGIMVCHDAVFPEAARAVAVAGAELFVVPSLIKKAGSVPWLYYLRARALENRVPVASANIYFPPEVVGQSRIIDLEYDKKEHIMSLTERTARPGITNLLAEVDIASKRRYRKERLRELRPSAY